eukprot:NODE_26977_length_530_cov_3.858561.p1 GENE.NODE_26977_length_530_cov_3.858561~~NODE_26977_length_530_cov_3.858561.p1  ORF type:complete len:114 (-),score=31.84 NODE_26977_length_530_cov_3.858561:151-492(-)
MSGGGNPWACICEFMRSQSDNLISVMNNVANQNTVTDLDTSNDALQPSSGINPLHVFLFLMLAVWGFLYLNGRNRQDVSKPRPGGDHDPSASSGGSSGSGSGGGGGGVGGELF